MENQRTAVAALGVLCTYLFAGDDDFAQAEPVRPAPNACQHIVAATDRESTEADAKPRPPPGTGAEAGPAPALAPDVPATPGAPPAVPAARRVPDRPHLDGI